MTCREFERRWNELLDGYGGTRAERAVGTPTDPERHLIAHAAGCPRCREIAAKYEALRNAIRAWGPPPPAPAGLASRVLAEFATPTQPARWPQAWRWVAAASIAAGVLAVVVVDRVVPRDRAIARQPAHIEQPDQAPVDAKSDRVDYRRSTRHWRTPPWRPWTLLGQHPSRRRGWAASSLTRQRVPRQAGTRRHHRARRGRPPRWSCRSRRSSC